MKRRGYPSAKYYAATGKMPNILTPEKFNIIIKTKKVARAGPKVMADIKKALEKKYFLNEVQKATLNSLLTGAENQKYYKKVERFSKRKLKLKRVRRKKYKGVIPQKKFWITSLGGKPIEFKSDKEGF